MGYQVERAARWFPFWFSRAMNMKHRQVGVALIEFALVLPFLLLLAFITTEYGRALYQYNTLAKSVRDAVRFLSIQDLGSDPATIATAPADATKNLVVYGDVVNTGTPLAFGLSVAQVKTPTRQFSGAGPVIRTVTVTIAGCASSAPPCYKFTPIFSGAFGLDFGDINYADISATMRAPL
jgi:Flp pilus assembly protein TadG